MPIGNGGFETQGASPGVAANWTLSSSAAAERLVGFGVPALGYEGFEWATPFEDLLSSDIWGTATFDPTPENREDFEEGWGNDNYQRTLTDGLSAALPVDGFESGWGNDSGHFVTWDDIADAPASFGTERFTPDVYERYFDDVPSTAYVFDDPDTAAAEGFGGTWTTLTEL
ncbi:MAG: hypothetical protein KKH12_16040 [Gammaproteobacteria bacterium]|nr:hypothetical protein [Gammaproteobacteria bacterium]